jgi:3-methylcrotonyl-CoA carboxylase alpha subunit
LQSIPVLLGPARARDSYLNIDRILEAARETGAEAIHPGYGFLSESDVFARRCAEAGIVFVGPSGDMIEAMGSKSGAKALMEKAGVPLVPGYHGEAQDEATLAKAAEKIGFPVLVKASAGGGGRGMRVVRAAGELSAAIVSAKREAKAAFGDDRMLIERYVDNPRHIEVQVVGDSHGNLVSLFERECTLQRRHQKVIEEAPSPTLDDKQRAAIGLAARKAAGAVKYVGAGTIEFVSDGKDFFFIEMNTRLQVEHPVTELITGVDLVEWQLRVAFGEALPLRQDDIRLNGHAVEARVYAENPAKNFMPSVGRIRAWRTPDEMAGLRIDAGYGTGSNVSPHYDAMLAKVISFGESRAVALDRIVAALDNTDVRGVVTNLPFLSALLSHPEVRANRIDTGFIERHLQDLTKPVSELKPADIAAAVAAVLVKEVAVHDKRSPWSKGGWTGAGERRRTLTFRDAQGGEWSAAQVYGGNGMTLTIGGADHAFAVHAAGGDAVDSFLDGVKTRAVAIWEDRNLYLRTPSGRVELSFVDPFGVDHDEHAGEDRIVAPLPGTVVAVLAEEGATLEKGAPVLTLEVMKMEQTLRAPFAGVLKRMKCKVGDIVQEGVELAEIEPS